MDEIKASGKKEQLEKPLSKYMKPDKFDRFVSLCFKN